ncbi:hypothetical protein CEXT_649861 [Caerostris extrusa]|uniref:Secreted protein n=1 Tax=Caerostris extrusa TaxID=172846 RepID=A0AAV4MJ83_CAEEX|nr:hypothetical protein CEXT_649861 [Caerostris extrusa]
MPLLQVFAVISLLNVTLKFLFTRKQETEFTSKTPGSRNKSREENHSEKAAKETLREEEKKKRQMKKKERGRCKKGRRTESKTK